MSDNLNAPTTPVRKVVAYTAGTYADNAQVILDAINVAYDLAMGYEDTSFLPSPQAVIDRVAEDGDTVDKLFKITIEEVGTTE